MKRTLVEILAGLAVLVLMASFHQRLARLNADAQEAKELRSLVEQTSRRLAAEPGIDAMRTELLAKVDERVAELERRVADATRSAKDASFLKAEVEQARRTAATIKAEIERDVSRTRELVQTYADELRLRTENATQNAERDRAEIDKLNGIVLPNPDQLTSDLLLPAVQLNGQDTVGSGTLIRSCKDAATGKVENWVLTAYHVVRNILTDSPESQRDGIAVTLYDPSGKVETRGELVAFDKDLDSALLRLKTDRLFSHVARVLPRDQAEHIQVWTDIYAIGCPLGNDPIPTRGSIASKQNVLNGTNYWMINAPTYYGNSGGGIFLAESRVLIGVFSKIYTHGRGNPVVIPHMGLCTPIQSIYEWLDREKLGHLIETPVPMPDLAAPGK